MTSCLTEPRDQIFVKGYGFLSFAKNMSKNTGKNVSKNKSDIYSPVVRQKTWSCQPIGCRCT